LPRSLPFHARLQHRTGAAIVHGPDLFIQSALQTLVELSNRDLGVRPVVRRAVQGLKPCDLITLLLLLHVVAEQDFAVCDEGL
jgi:hypothetical protein